MSKNLKIAMGCDCYAYDFKVGVLELLKMKGYSITDFGCNSSNDGDYVEIAKIVGEKVASGEFDRGLLFCGTGQGMVIAANKIKGIRAALCFDVLPALLTREHNDSNILTMGPWMISVEKAIRVIDVWLVGLYEWNHEYSLNYIKKLEESR